MLHKYQDDYLNESKSGSKKCLKCLKLRYSADFNESVGYKPLHLNKLISPF